MHVVVQRERKRQTAGAAACAGRRAVAAVHNGGASLWLMAGMLLGLG